MRMIQLPIFTYAELSEKVQNKVMNNVVTFLLETASEDSSPEVLQAIEKAEGMLTPWFAKEYIMEYCKDEVMYLCNGNEYFSNGTLYQNLRT